LNFSFGRRGFFILKALMNGKAFHKTQELGKQYCSYPAKILKREIAFTSLFLSQDIQTI
jgi:hypothetical protein